MSSARRFEGAFSHVAREGRGPCEVHSRGSIVAQPDKEISADRWKQMVIEQRGVGGQRVDQGETRLRPTR